MKKRLNDQITRVLACVVLLVLCGCVAVKISSSQRVIQRVWVFSDLHVGNDTASAGGVDGSEWMRRACAELKTNNLPMDYALVLGDLTKDGLAEEVDRFLAVRDQSGIATWFTLAGNHEYNRTGIGVYEKKIRSTKPYCVVAGNIAWFLLSDEKPGVAGELSEATMSWLEQKLTEHKDKIIIVSSHQLVYDTVKASNKKDLYLEPKEAIASLLARHHVDLWLSGHAHHAPWTEASAVQKNGTWFINVASLSHAYNTGESQSFVLEFTEGARQLMARRRDHDKQAFSDKGVFVIPLQQEIKLGKPCEK
jgi:predicted MPP superfamily phosphohydrolase